MEQPYRQLAFDREGEVYCAWLRHRKIDESSIDLLGRELLDLVENQGCRRLALSLGPGTLECLYSVFLAKLVMIHRRISECQGAMILFDITPEVMSVFAACKLQTYFEFAADRQTAVDAVARKILS